MQCKSTNMHVHAQKQPMKSNIASSFAGTSDNVVRLESLLGQKTNCVEIYLLDKKRSHDSGGDIDVHAINVENTTCTNLVVFGQGSTTNYINYAYRELVYTYDMSNDAQRVTKRSLATDDFIPYGNNPQSMYVMCLEEDTLPSHRYPCVNKTSHKTYLTRTSYRINNRMFIYKDVTREGDGDEDEDTSTATTCIYVRYNHAPQVDIAQMQGDLNRVLRMLHKKHVPN